MESGAIRDDAITASSSFDSSNVGPQQGRRLWGVTVATSAANDGKKKLTQP
ncbi:hypothetical protein Phum_PHUM542440 [Pediculus humanus corporis]|uniref:Uncharacterized protein n=1 Tax=Pediculus humanus subsp. corporis TaxID=121224 RepID=E0W015_PEDHC|nr:uncharacterized protein Phum_PHUM542440 [Pediculus humanus corporis]EEB18971.1 hypothetical protein Phum_PHUM542440 [Pediculus humanus corporis]